MASERLERALGIKPQPEKQEPAQAATDTSEGVEWTCAGCSDTEETVLVALQKRGITDKNALAVVMGNIKQESKFQTTICEGGQKTGYSGCHRGGFGLIQWTTIHRYQGLGRVAHQHGVHPDSLDAQLKWLFTEREWQKVEPRFKTPGHSLGYYMSAAYRWLGWGVHGRRSVYAQRYLHYLRLT